MTANSDDHERTMAFAEIALGQIKALRQPATPRVYEVWYSYATGYNPVPQRDDQRNAHAQRHAERDRHRPDLRNLPVSDPPWRTHRQGRQSRHGRDRAGHVDGGCRGRQRIELQRKPRRRQPATRQYRRPRGPARDRGKPRPHRQGDGDRQQQARSAAERLASRKSTSCRKTSKSSAPKA